jgi:UDP-glucose 4-epimerase
MAKCLITGGGGFIGSHLAERLVKDGHAVRVLDNFSSGKRSNLEHIAGPLEIIEGDLRSAEDCRRACRQMEVIFHQAAVPSVPRSVEDPATSHAANVDGTFNLLVAARDAGCRRVVFAASSSAYGDVPQLPKRENMAPTPLSPYAVNKLVGEYYCSVFSTCYGLETVSLRYFNVFGPRQDPKSQYAAAIPAFVTSILRGEPPIIYGDGEQTRDFTYIDNVVHANVLAATASGLKGQVLNIACGASVTVNNIIRQINALLGTSVKPCYEPERPGDVKHSLADIALAKEVIGYEPLVMFDTGLRRAIDFYKSCQ